LLVVSAGCGAPVRPGLSGDSGAIEEDGGGGGGGGGGSSGGGGGDGGAGDGSSGPLRGGWVFASSNTITASGTDYSSASFNASFYQYSGAVAPGSCTITTSGSCTLTQCPPAGDGGVPVTPNLPHAGTLTISGAKRTFTLSPKADGSYPTEIDNMKPLYSGGETLTISATGGTAPAFSASVVAPARVRVSAPVLPAAGQSLVITRASGLSCVWSGGTVGEVTFGVYPQSATSWVNCTFAASAGSGSIPSSLLSKLPGGSGSFNASLRNTTRITPSGWSIDLWAYQSVVTTAGASFVGLATLQ
jgi:hypothetical protein